MSTTIMKPSAPVTDHRPLMKSSLSSSSPLRGSAKSPNQPTFSTANGLNRTRSIRAAGGAQVSARGTVKRPSPSLSNPTSNDASTVLSDQEEFNTKAESIALMEELRLRVHKAETASDEYQRQLAQLQARLDESSNEQGRLEERTHQAEERIEWLEDERQDNIKQRNELESQHEAERVAMSRAREEQSQREDDYISTIQRLKEKLIQKDSHACPNDDTRNSQYVSQRSHSSPNLDVDDFAPSSSLQRDTSNGDSILILQKDKIIESLRLELAEAQIKSMELESVEGERLRALEKGLMETRVINARLVEENESFQLLLRQKTLQGEFSSTDVLRGDTSCSDETRSFGAGEFGSSLADELESATNEEGESQRRLENEIRSLKEQNKALSLYINSIIERLLNHKEFEAILDKTPGLMAGPNAASVRHAGSVLKEDIPPRALEEPAVPTSFLQRAKTAAIGAPRSLQRPMSMMPPPAKPLPQLPKANDALTGAAARNGSNLTRSASSRSNGHRRANTEFSHADIVSSMCSGRTPSGSISPVVLPNPRQNPFFTPTSSQQHPNAPSRTASGSLIHGERAISSSHSVSSNYSGEVDSPSPPRSLAGSANSGTGAIVGGKKLRPLRLVQENMEMGSGFQGGILKKGENTMGEDSAAARRAKRGSWMGWFNKGKDGPASLGASSMEVA